MAEHDDASSKPAREERQFMRLSDEVRVDLRRLEPEEADALAAQLATGATLSGEDPEEVLARLGEGEEPLARLGRVLLARLGQIDEKLQRLTEKLAPERVSGPAGWATGQSLDVSGSGLAAVVPLACAPGDRLEVRLSLPGGQGRIRALGRVVHVMEPDGQEVPVGRHRLGIGFDAIHESDREALIRAIFRRQRVMLREGQLQAPD
jgi:hypothetical protein